MSTGKGELPSVMSKEFILIAEFCPFNIDDFAAIALCNLRWTW